MTTFTITPEITANALEESIKKWERNAEIKFLDDAVMGWNNCPLCAIFYFDKQGFTSCKGCPVYEFTKLIGCANTPYDRAEDAEDNRDLEGFLQAAKDEVEFLKSLRSPK